MNVNNYPDRSIDESNFNPVDGGGTPNCDLTEIFEKTTVGRSEGASISEKEITEWNEEAQKLTDRTYSVGKRRYNRSIEYHELASKRFKPLADQGNFEAKKKLGDVYSGIESIYLEKKEDIDKDKALEHYELAARCFESLAEADLWVEQKLQAVYFNIGSIHIEKKRDVDEEIEYSYLAPYHSKSFET